MDSNRTNKPTAIGVLEDYYDYLPCLIARRPHRKDKHVTRSFADCRLYWVTVHIGTEAAGLGHFAGVYGNLLRNDIHLRNQNKITNWYYNCRHCLNAYFMALYEGLSKNEDYGFP